MHQAMTRQGTYHGKFLKDLSEKHPLTFFSSFIPVIHSHSRKLTNLDMNEDEQAPNHDKCSRFAALKMPCVSPEGVKDP